MIENPLSSIRVVSSMEWLPMEISQIEAANEQPFNELGEISSVQQHKMRSLAEARESKLLVRKLKKEPMRK
jgi:hypothetical protein